MRGETLATANATAALAAKATLRAAWSEGAASFGTSQRGVRGALGGAWVLILDEMEKVRPETIDGLVSLVEEATVDAPMLVLLISDFGREGFTHGLTREEVRDRVDREMVATWQSPKSASVVSDIIPFQPLDVDALTVIAEKEHLASLSRLMTLRDAGVRRVSWDAEVPRALAVLSARRYPTLNARGLTRVFNDLVQDPAIRLVSQVLGDDVDDDPLFFEEVSANMMRTVQEYVPSSVRLAADWLSTSLPALPSSLSSSHPPEIDVASDEKEQLDYALHIDENFHPTLTVF